MIKEELRHKKFQLELQQIEGQNYKTIDIFCQNYDLVGKILENEMKKKK